jgi:hypothetical protein
VTLKPAGRIASDRLARRMVQFAGFVFYLLSVQALVTAGVGVHVFLTGGSAQDLLLPCMSGILACCYVLVGFHLRRHRLWARNFAFAFAGFSLFAFPVGTGLGLVIIGLVAGANRARVFPQLRRGPAPTPVEEQWPLLRFEPDLVAEQAG